jgi:hypothetical protein
MSKNVTSNQSISRQCVGIDISKDSFVACISHKTSSDEIIVKSTKKSVIPLLALKPYRNGLQSSQVLSIH